MDVTDKVHPDEGWFYSDIVKDHFFNPRNLMHTYEEAREFEPDGEGMVGDPACGDMMNVYIKCDKVTDCIKDCKWLTFGCASAIASTSMMSEMVVEDGGMQIDEALEIKPKQIMERLGGLPSRKFHCSVLGDKALKGAIHDYFEKTGQEERIT